MKENDLVTRRDVEIALLEKGQRSRRYKLGDIWELNFDEIREALSKYQQKIVRCKDCKHQHEYRTGSCPYYTTYGLVPPNDWFCADGKGDEVNDDSANDRTIRD